MSLLGLLARRAAARAFFAGEGVSVPEPGLAGGERDDAPSQEARDDGDAPPASIREPPA